MPLNFAAKAAITIGLSLANAALTMSRRIEGPRLDDRSFTDGDYGASVPRIWGKRRIAPPIVAADDLREVKRRRKTKGGKYNEYSYFGTWMEVLACHEIAGIARIWFDGKLVFDLTGAGPVTPFDFGDRATRKSIDEPMGVGVGGTNYGDAIALYLGTTTQEPDPRLQALVEAKHGEGSCPAYRGTAYIVLKDIPLEKFGNRIPQVEVELLGTADETFPYETFDTLIAPPSSLQGFAFSPDRSRFMWSRNDMFEIWDTAARARMISGAISPDLAAQDMFGIFNDGTIYAVGVRFPTSGNQKIYSLGADGLGSSPVFEVVSGGHRQQAVRVLEDGNGIEHWMTVPWSTLKTFYFDGTAMTGLALTGIDWQPSFFFSDEAGNIWIAAYGNSTTSYLYRIVTVEADCPGFITVSGLAANAGGTVPQAACRDAATGNFILAWGFISPELLYSIDAQTGAVLGSLAVTLNAGTAYQQFANHPPGAPSIWIGQREIELASLTVLRTIDPLDWVNNGDSGGDLIYDPINHALIGAHSWDNEITFRYLDRATSDGVTLRTVVEDVCALAGIAAGDIDASALTQTIRGYSVTQGTGKDWLEPLLDLYDIDPRPHGFVLQFVPRGGAAGAAISHGSFAEPDGGGDTYSFPRSGGTDVPVQMTLAFADVNADQQKNFAMSGPLAGREGEGELTLDMATLVLDGDEARQMLARYHRRKLLDRIPYSFALCARMAALEPADVHPVELRSVTETMRNAKMELRADGRIATEWKRDDPSIALLDGATGAGYDGYTQPVIAVPLISKGFVLDLPLLTDADNDSNPLLYIAAGPYGEGSWPGATIFEAVDGEYSDEFGSVASNAPATWGYASDALPDVPSPWCWDRGNSVNIRLQSGTLTGCTEADIDADPTLNLCLLGGEVMNFTGATLEGDGSYTLSGLRRGRRGTEWACAQHGVNDVFLLLDTAEAEDRGLSDVGTDLSFKAVTEGRTASGAFPLDLAFAGNSLKPYAPADVRAEKQANGDWVISWKWRTRVGGDFRSGVAPSSAEASLSFHVTLGDGVSEATKTVSSSPYTWDVATQTTDTGGEVAAGSLECAVAQISATVGDGWETEIAA
jgi:hypothetical protein